jgi:hypothetical protein
MDTDSLYFAISAEKLEDILLPEKEEYYKNKHQYFPRTTDCSCNSCKNDINLKEHSAYDKRTPGLFKLEKDGDAMIALTSKSYFLRNSGGNKAACKGTQVTRNSEHIQFEKYKECLLNRNVIEGENAGFRLDPNTKAMITYKQRKVILSPVYLKRVIFNDGIHTRPLTPVEYETEKESETEQTDDDDEI